MQHASGKDYDPSAWAKQRQERIKRAFQVGAASLTLLFLSRLIDTYVLRRHQQLFIVGCAPCARGTAAAVRSYLPSFTVLTRISLVAGRIHCALGRGKLLHRKFVHRTYVLLSTDFHYCRHTHTQHPACPPRREQLAADAAVIALLCSDVLLPHRRGKFCLQLYM